MSKTKSHVLRMQKDGNLVCYNGDKAIWASSTCHVGSGPYRFVMQEDNNAVVYGQNGSAWSTKTNNKGVSPARFVMQADGNLVIYDGHNKVLWASGTRR